MRVSDSRAGRCMLGGRASSRLLQQTTPEEPAMIKDVMVRLDGSAADEVRLAAVDAITELYQGRIVGLFLNVLPLLLPSDGDSVGAIHAAELLQKAREAGNRIEQELTQRLARLQKPAELRRFDVFSDEIGDIAAREARAADTFVALRPNGAPSEPEQLVEGVLFGSGRHLYLVPDRKPGKAAFNHVLIDWNGSREAARALAEAMPFLHKAGIVTVVVVLDEDEVEENAILGTEAVDHLKHHGINATLHRSKNPNRDAGAILIAEAQRQQADLLVMGGYGHSRLREWLLGGVTYELLHNSPVPLLVAH
jgi:nucleotide-binding universal stress UspA family protein